MMIAKRWLSVTQTRQKPAERSAQKRQYSERKFAKSSKVGRPSRRGGLTPPGSGFYDEDLVASL
jgi:hypothetical protein